MAAAAAATASTNACDQAMGQIYALINTTHWDEWILDSNAIFWECGPLEWVQTSLCIDLAGA